MGAKKEEHRTTTAPPTPAKGRKNSTQPMLPVHTGSFRLALLLANLDLAARFGGIWGKQNRRSLVVQVFKVARSATNHSVSISNL